VELLDGSTGPPAKELTPLQGKADQGPFHGVSPQVTLTSSLPLATERMDRETCHARSLWAAAQRQPEGRAAFREGQAALVAIGETILQVVATVSRLSTRMVAALLASLLAASHSSHVVDTHEARRQVDQLLADQPRPSESEARPLIQTMSVPGRLTDFGCTISLGGPGCGAWRFAFQRNTNRSS
jgi:hypothetical protein